MDWFLYDSDFDHERVKRFENCREVQMSYYVPQVNTRDFDQLYILSIIHINLLTRNNLKEISVR